MITVSENSSKNKKECKGIKESFIIPILLSSLTTTELCLMFFIERDKEEQNVYYRSRSCQVVTENGSYCISCQELFHNLNHFHYLHLKKPCEQFHSEDRTTEPKQKLVNNHGDVTLTLCEVKSEEKSEETSIYNMCEECGEVFNDLTDLAKHCKVKHSEIQNEDLERNLQKINQIEENVVVEETGTLEEDVDPSLKLRKKYPCKYCTSVILKKSMWAHKKKFHPIQLKEEQKLWKPIIKQDEKS